MGRYFEYRDWELENICQNLREYIHVSRQPIPAKIKKHCVSILYREGETCYIYPNYGWFSYGVVPEFKTREDAEKYLESLPDIKKIDGLWVDVSRNEIYETSDGKKIPCHYIVRESDYEVYADDEYHIEFSEEEKQKLSEALYNIEKARVYLRVFDYCCDQSSFGEDRFSNELKEELDKFENNYNEDYIPDKDDEFNI